MVTLADSLVSSTSRAIRLRMRPDLSVKRQQYQGTSYWVVKEPIGLNYYRFHDEEYAILNMMDGQTSMETMKEEFERQFAPQKVSFSDLQHFIGQLHRSGLVISEAPGQGRQLKHRRDTKRRKEFLGKFTNVFAIRWRGIDPERILNRLYPWTGWMFSPLAICFVVLWGLCALTLVAVQFDVFQSKMPTFHQFFGAHNWIYLGTSMALVKVVHEFGHGLTCKRYGGECHEMGFMLLVFTPAVLQRFRFLRCFQTNGTIFMGLQVFYVECSLLDSHVHLVVQPVGDSESSLSEFDVHLQCKYSCSSTEIRC